MSSNWNYPYGNYWKGDDFAEYDKPKKCQHEWKAITLIITVVYDCTRCGAKKEETEE